MIGAAVEEQVRDAFGKAITKNRELWYDSDYGAFAIGYRAALEGGRNET